MTQSVKAFVYVEAQVSAQFEDYPWGNDTPPVLGPIKPKNLTLASLPGCLPPIGLRMPVGK